MKRLTFFLTYTRAAKPASEAASDCGSARARGAVCTTRILADGVKSGCEPLTEGVEAVMESCFKVDADNVHFTESGSVSIGGGAALTFSTIGKGVLQPETTADGFNRGSIMWQVDEGSGQFAGAVGLIVSNFLVNLGNEQLIDHHLVVIDLPGD